MADAPPMPVFVIKSKDALALQAVAAYRDLCISAGLAAQAEQVQLAIDEMIEWQAANEGSVKAPDHEHVPAGQSRAGGVPSSGSEMDPYLVAAQRHSRQIIEAGNTIEDRLIELAGAWHEHRLGGPNEHAGLVGQCEAATCVAVRDAWSEWQEVTGR